MMGGLLNLVLAYLIGSVSGSLLLGRLKHVDIRTMGSGNAGGTNAFRTQGLVFALGVVLIDVGKALLATALVPGLGRAAEAGLLSGQALQLACAGAVILGHCYPLYHGFRGGKGAATTVGCLLVIAPWLLAPMLLTWLLVLAVSGYVGLATVVAGFSLVPSAWLVFGPSPVLVFTVAVALFMTFTHRGNLSRMREGTEGRFNRPRLARWLRR
ncbi:MAG TPA: glycerol-3-phosphate 1-O-acyltransferase PlsY [Xanthomonadales bacterium]|nr:glycerol-3-phosphate 1-O-acyltransferase PlsY [Xanthomonadales bacterium]